MTSNQIHRSKIGAEILIPVVLVLGLVTSLMIMNKVWVGLAVCGAVVSLIANIYTGTYYKITPENQLHIKCGVLESLVVDIHDIEWIKRSSDLSNAPALSIDRLEIGYKGGKVLVSPKDKTKFVNDLKKLNSKIWWIN